MLRRRFPELKFEIENFPVPPLRALLGQIFSTAFMVGIAVGFIGKSFLPEAVNNWIGENSMVFYGGLFVLNMIGGQMLQTGAFELSLDGTLIFSKLQTGSIPDVNWLAQAIGEKLQ